MKKKIIRIKIVENIILTMIKIYIIALSRISATATYIDGYFPPKTNAEKNLILGLGIGTSIALDIIINVIIYKILKKQEDVKLINFFVTSFMITIFIWYLFKL